MKKALVLGVLAIFAISISNVNAQEDRTNVQQKPKKTYNQEPASKNMDTKTVSPAKAADPTGKNAAEVKGTTGGHKVSKGAKMGNIDKKQSEVVSESNVGGAKTLGTSSKNLGNKTSITTTEDNDKAKKLEEEANLEKMNAEQDRASVNAKGTKKPGAKINNSVPPTSKEKKNASGKKTVDR